MANFGFGEADSTKGWVGVEAITGDAVGDAARGLIGNDGVEEIGGDDFEVVVGGVGEGATAVAVAERPDAGDTGTELVVDDDVAVLVVGDAGFFEAEVVGVGTATDCEENVGAYAVGSVVGAVDAYCDIVAARFEVECTRR